MLQMFSKASIIRRDSFINAGFGAALAILFVIGFLSYLNIRETTGFDGKENRSYVVMLELEGVLSALDGMADAERLFILSGEKRYLLSYRERLHEVERHLASLKNLSNNHPDQLTRVLAVEPLLKKRQALAEEAIGARRQEEGDASSLLTQGIRRELLEVREAARGQLNRRASLKEASAGRMLQLLFVGYLACFVLLISPFLLLRREIGERRRVEIRLRNLSLQNELILSSAGEGIIGLDLEGNHTFVNRSAALLLGHEADELVGKPSHATWHYARPDGTPYPDAECPVYASYKDGARHSGEEVFWRKDGSSFPVAFTTTPMFSGSDMVGAVLTFSDITQQKQAQDALRKSEELLSKIFQSVPALVGISTLREGRLIDMNLSGLKTLGFRREEIIGRTTRELGLWDDESKRDEVVRTLLEKGTVRDFESRFRTREGRQFIGLFSAEILSVEDDRLMLSLVKDISDLKLMEEEIRGLNASLALRAEELEQANRELEAFNYTVAHDLRKPLTVVNAYCQAIMATSSGTLDPRSAQYLQEAYNGTLRMNQLIDALLDFSRLAHVELVPTAVDLSELALDAAAELKASDPGRRVAFRVAPGMTAQGDPDLLRVVLDNLLGNAWKYTGARQEGEVEFGRTVKDGRPVCFVRDNGTGFDMADAGNLFLPFKRLPGVEGFRGVGIGLATVERIIQRHGGEIWAEGEPDKGATFYFTVPGMGDIPKHHPPK